MGEAFCQALYHARFLQGKDIADEEILRKLATANGLDAQALIDALSKRQYKKKLLQGMSRAKHAGVFGVPYIVYKDSPIGAMTDSNGLSARLTGIRD